MRIIAGEYRGRRIEAPAENITRPTVDRVREAMFSSLESLRGGLEGAVVLDAFAGSGAMGLEALSRGAYFACFLEQNKMACNIVKDNIKSLGITGAQAKVVFSDAFKYVPDSPSDVKFDVVFLDPPYCYESKEVAKLLREFVAAGTVSDDFICMYEHDKSTCIVADAAYEEFGFALIKRRNYGRVAVDTLKLDNCATIT